MQRRSKTLKSALVFLGGFYDKRYYKFYKRQIEEARARKDFLICADGGLNIFQIVNEQFSVDFCPDAVIGDLDSVLLKERLIGHFSAMGAHFVTEWIGQSDKDYTDGQLAVAYAMQEKQCQQIVLFGALTNPRDYEFDHFLGNLKLMRFGFKIGDKRYRACIRDALQEIHFVINSIVLKRKGNAINSVSLLTDYENTIVESSSNLRWVLNNFRISPDEPNALRNEFVKDAETALIKLKADSAPVYVIHNWYRLECKDLCVHFCKRDENLSDNQTNC